jgi:hypothetical protein
LEILWEFFGGGILGGSFFLDGDLVSSGWQNCAVRWFREVTADLSDSDLAAFDSDSVLFASNSAELGADDSWQVIRNSAAFDAWLAEFDGDSAGFTSKAAEFAAGAAGFDANSAERIGQSQFTVFLPAMKEPRVREALVIPIERGEKKLYSLLSGYQVWPKNLPNLFGFGGLEVVWNEGSLLRCKGLGLDIFPHLDGDNGGGQGFAVRFRY